MCGPWSQSTRICSILRAANVFDTGYAFALNVATGEEQWRVEISGTQVSPPTVAAGTVYVGSWDGFLYALDAGVDGSSEGSRVLLGTYGHHDGWRYADQTIDLDAIGPTAVLEVDRETNTAGEDVNFDASTSSHPFDAITTYEWDFDDGSLDVGDDPEPSHRYRAPGTYDVTLTVVDYNDETDTDGVTIIVDEQAAENESGDDAVSGFGIAGTLGALGGAGYVYTRRMGEHD